MKPRQIYKKIIIFSFPRIPFLLAAFFANLVLSFFFNALIRLWPSAAHIISPISAVLMMFIYSFVNNYGAKVYRTAQIAMITQALQTGTLPERTFSAGIEAVNQHFESSTLRQFFTGSFRIFYLRVFKNKSREEVRKEVGFNWIDVIRSLIIFYGLYFIPYLGFCVTGYQFSHPNQSMIRNLCDGAEIFLTNPKKMQPKIIVTIILELLFYIPFIIILFTALLIFNTNHTVLNNLFYLAVSGKINQPLTVEVLAVYISMTITILAVFSIKLFLQPRVMIGIIKKYFLCCEFKPSKGRLYKIMPEWLKATDTVHQSEDDSDKENLTQNQ